MANSELDWIKQKNGRGDKLKTAMSARLTRTAFTTDRMLEFFTERELTTQLGYGRELWPLVLVKELIDNSLDACESTGVPPNITVIMDEVSVTVRDNGPGLPVGVLDRSLDYTIRVSDKKNYIAPTRGQLGNALKCVWAAGFVAHGAGSIEVVTGGRRHLIDVSLDRLAQKPKIHHQQKPAKASIGTSVKFGWPGIASYQTGSDQDFYRDLTMGEALDELIKNFAAFNPHATFVLRRQDAGRTYPATNPEWKKWRTIDPTSAHWYTPAHLRDLMAAYINAGKGDQVLRQFLAEFIGLKGTQIRRAILESANGARRLKDLVAGDDLDMAAVAGLLDAMKKNSKPVVATRLGVLGKNHVETVLASECEPGSIEYRKIADTDDEGLPCVIECGFGINNEADGRKLIVGINWSPVFKLPSSEITSILEGMCRVSRWDQVTVFLHLAHPRFAFSDHGKGALL